MQSSKHIFIECRENIPWNGVKSCWGLSLHSCSFRRVPPMHTSHHANRQQETLLHCVFFPTQEAWGWNQRSSACEYGEKNPFLLQGFNVMLMVSDMITENRCHMESRWLMCKSLTAETRVVSLPSWLSYWDLVRKGSSSFQVWEHESCWQRNKAVLLSWLDCSQV